MRAHKLCLLGDFGVGKTSLVARFVRSTFSDKYLTTVGVKVDSKEVALPGRAPLKLVIWDIAGRGTLDAPGANYLRGASALLMVADEPLDRMTLASAVGHPVSEVDETLAGLAAEYDDQGRGFELRHVAGGWRYYTREALAPVVEGFTGPILPRGSRHGGGRHSGTRSMS